METIGYTYTNEIVLHHINLTEEIGIEEGCRSITLLHPNVCLLRDQGNYSLFLLGYKDGEPSWSFGPGTFCPCCMSEDERDMIRELVENTVPEGEQVTWYGQWGNTSLNNEWLGFNPDRYKHSEKSVRLSDEAREFLGKVFLKEKKVEQSR